MNSRAKYKLIRADRPNSEFSFRAIGQFFDVEEAKGREMNTMKYELVFEGSARPVGYRFPRYRRYHSTLASAQQTADEMKEKLETIHHPQGGSIAGCHNPIVYGSGLEDAGEPLRWL